MDFEQTLNQALDESEQSPRVPPASMVWHVYIRGRYTNRYGGRLVATSEAAATAKARKHHSNSYVVRSDLDTVSPGSS